MTSIIEPTPAQLKSLVAPYLTDQPVAFAIGYASPSFANNGNIFLAGNVQSQLGTALDLNRYTLFEIASISKTFTATLYAQLLRGQSSTLTVGDFIYPNGKLHISSTLAAITLDELMSYTSGLPQDNEDGTVDSPPYWAYPYSMPGMLSYLDLSPPPVSGTGTAYTYSNLAFAIMSSILASGGPVTAVDFAHLIRENVFEPLSMQSKFFDGVSLGRLAAGYTYDSSSNPVYTQTNPGWVFFPAYFGAGGIVASPNDMWQWLLFNMGVTQNTVLSPLLPALQSPATTVKDPYDDQLGLGWFINPAENGWVPTVWKDGGLEGFNSYIAFLPSPDPGSTPSQAGVFVLVNADSITENGVEIVAVIANDLLLIMQGQEPPADKSKYPRADLRRPRKSGLRRP